MSSCQPDADKRGRMGLSAVCHAYKAITQKHPGAQRPCASQPRFRCLLSTCSTVQHTAQILLPLLIFALFGQEPAPVACRLTTRWFVMIATATDIVDQNALQTRPQMSQLIDNSDHISAIAGASVAKNRIRWSDRLLFVLTAGTSDQFRLISIMSRAFMGRLSDHGISKLGRSLCCTDMFLESNSSDLAYMLIKDLAKIECLNPDCDALTFQQTLSGSSTISRLSSKLVLSYKACDTGLNGQYATYRGYEYMHAQWPFRMESITSTMAEFSPRKTGSNQDHE
nr:hypothetical protein CFP56_07800 [Quercus suber]